MAFRRARSRFRSSLGDRATVQNKTEPVQFTGAFAPADQLPMPRKNQLGAQPNYLHAAVGAPVEDSKRSVLEVLNQRGRHVVTCMLFECMAVHPLFTVQTG